MKKKESNHMAGKKKSKVAAKKSRRSSLAQQFADADAAGSREPLFDEGKHRCKFMSLEQKPPVAGQNEWAVAKFELEDETERAGLFCISNKSLSSSLPRMKSLLMAVLGCESADEYNAFDPTGAFLDAVMGLDTEGECVPTEADDPDYQEMLDQFEGASYADVAEQIVGTWVIVKCTRGNDTQDGDWYRNLSFEADDSDE